MINNDKLKALMFCSCNNLSLNSPLGLTVPTKWLAGKSLSYGVQSSKESHWLQLLQCMERFNNINN